MRSTRSHTANRRLHYALKGMRLSVSKDGTVHPRHRALLDGTQYRGRSVMDVSGKRTARSVKAAKRREKESGPSEKKQDEQK